MGALVLVAVGAVPADAYPRPGATERVSVASDGAEGDADSAFPSVSADGRHVAFHSPASNLVQGDTNDFIDVFVHDRDTGATERVSVASDGAEGNYPSIGPAISADGRHVAFHSFASNLGPEDTNGASDIFVHDRDTGTTERVSVATDGAEANGVSVYPAISADGRHVAFHSSACNLVTGDTNCGFGVFDVFVHDREIGVTERVSVASDGAEALANSFDAALSADGRHVAFHSDAPNLVPGDANDSADVFVHDRQTGATERVSVAADGTEGDQLSRAAAISADGRHVAFHSNASNLVPGDANDTWDIFVHDRQTGATERVSVASDGAETDIDSAFPAVSADGRYVAFHSFASNLVPGDSNGVWDVFVRDRGPDAGVGSLGAQRAGGELTVSGWASFSGATVASAEDPADDGVEPLGAEVTAASVIYRPEQEDLLLRMDLMSLPGLVAESCFPEPCMRASTGAGAAGVVYRWAFAVGETAYEVRALRAAATADPATTEPYFALYECALVCTETRLLSGGIGTTGANVRVSVPLEAIGAEEGAALTAIEASTALGEATPGAVVTLDDVAPPDASIPVSRVELGIAPPSAAQADVSFTAQADLVEGRFSARLDVSSLPPGAHRVWARACLGQTCGATSAPVILE